MEKLLLLIILFFCLLTGISSKNNKGTVILDHPGFPYIFELNQGESQTIIRSYGGKSVKKTITLKSIKTFMEPNLWFTDENTPMNYYQADVTLNVSDKEVILHHRPYQMPENVNGLKICIENVKEWDQHGKLGRTDDMKKQVRIAVCLENEPWGPESVIFPINNYKWRAAVYNNTWSGLVPFNLLYYHRGEDYGAIPDLLEVVSPIDGKILATPVPGGVKGSNSIVIESPDGIVFRFAHMNYETIVKENTVNSPIKAGALIGKTGMTWDGRKSQYNDPHLHVELSVKGVEVASFPYFMEAYQRKYPDQIFAVAGGYRFAVPGEKVVLDASRSFSRDKSSLQYNWKLSNGKNVKGPITSITYSKPGIYSEELMVNTKDGKQDRDFLYVTVFDPEKKRAMGYGWAYYYPLRDIKIGDEVIFWNRLDGTTSDVNISYGDGSKEIMQKESRHSYKNPGHYVVTLTSLGRNNEPLTLKMEVVVEK